MKGLTQRQQEIAEFIELFTKENRYAPSYREIMRHFGFSSVGSVYKHVQILKRKGVLEAEKQCSRSLSLVQAPESEQTFQVEVTLPFIGHVSAGAPVETLPQAQTLAVPAFLVHNPEHAYLLRARGDSLQDEQISDGDVMIIEVGREARAGETVLALIHQHDALIKRYYPEGHYIRFESHRSHVPSLAFYHEEVSVQGIVVGLFRVFG